MTNVIFASSEGCKRIKPRSIQRWAPMPFTPNNSTKSNKIRESAYPAKDRLRQTQIGVIAITSMIKNPSAKRFIWGSAQGRSDPPATE